MAALAKGVAEPDHVGIKALAKDSLPRGPVQMVRR